MKPLDGRMELGVQLSRVTYTPYSVNTTILDGTDLDGTNYTLISVPENYQPVAKASDRKNGNAGLPCRIIRIIRRVRRVVPEPGGRRRVFGLRGSLQQIPLLSLHTQPVALGLLVHPTEQTVLQLAHDFSA